MSSRSKRPNFDRAETADKKHIKRFVEDGRVSSIWLVLKHAPIRRPGKNKAEDLPAYHLYFKVGRALYLYSGREGFPRVWRQIERATKAHGALFGGMAYTVLDLTTS